MVNQMTDYMANIIAATIQNKMRTVSRNLVTGKTSLINAGNNNVITFPVIASDDIPKDIAEDIAKDIETLLAIATKNFIEGDVSRGVTELSMDAIMSSLPITRANAGPDDLNNNLKAAGVAYAFDTVANADQSIYAEAITMANRKLMEFKEKPHMYSEANQGIEIYREKGTGATYITVQIPYITGKQEVKQVQVQMGFEGVIRFCPKDELVTRIGAFDNNRFFKNYIKLSKGELSFMGDFLLELDRLKVEAKSTATANMLWKNLEMMNRKRDIFVKSYPFTTFIISDVVADEIKSKYMIDISQEKHVKALMESFFAFAFYEVNTGTNVVRVMRDGDALIKTMTVDDIVRNTTKVERKLRELIKIGG